MQIKEKGLIKKAEFSISRQLCASAKEMLLVGLYGRRIADELTAMVDGMVLPVFEKALRLSVGDQYNGLTMLAVGGFGRKDLAPYSDIDIMLLAEDRDLATEEAAQAVLYALWDTGMNISHSFRTAGECIEDSLKDITVRTSLMDCRFLAGNKDLYLCFRRDTYQSLVFKGRRDFVGGMLREIEARHKSYGNSVYLLEPNVKEGIGGLRDIHSALWLTKAALSESDGGLRKTLAGNYYDNFFKAYDFLLRARAALHVVSERKNEVLAFEFHGPTAVSVGLRNTKRFLADEIFMRLYHRKVKDIMDALDKVKQAGGRRFISFPVSLAVKKITEDFVVARRELAVRDTAVLRDTDRIMEAVYIYSVTGRSFSDRLTEGIRSRLLFINRKTRYSRKAISFFMRILSGERVYDTLRLMHNMGVLDRFIPEFGRLRHLVIYEPGHRYTVDEHTLKAVKNLEDLKRTQDTRLSYLSKIMIKIKPEVLYLAVLLHDTGKGVRGDLKHDEEGYLMLKGIMERFQVEHEDRSAIEFLVKNHILLSRLALSRDADAPETIAQLAGVVRNVDNLNALYLMTYADLSAVNPGFWTRWKEYLFKDLYTKTCNHLLGSRARCFETADIGLKLFCLEMPERYLISNENKTIRSDYRMSLELDKTGVNVSIKEERDGTALMTLVTMDRPGLFSSIVGVLTFKGINIRSARLYTGNNSLVVDRIIISNWDELCWDGFEAEIAQDLGDEIIRGSYLKDRMKDGSDTLMTKRSRLRYPSMKRFEGFVEIDNESSGQYSLLELFSSDRMGLLYDIAKLLYSYGIDILSAVINTEDDIAQDVFYIRYKGGRLDAETTLNILYEVNKVTGPVFGEALSKG
jgi:[protein-PII] uridylyltransferase